MGGSGPVAAGAGALLSVPVRPPHFLPEGLASAWCEGEGVELGGNNIATFRSCVRGLALSRRAKVNHTQRKGVVRLNVQTESPKKTWATPSISSIGSVSELTRWDKTKGPDDNAPFTVDDMTVGST